MHGIRSFRKPCDQSADQGQECVYPDMDSDERTVAWSNVIVHRLAPEESRLSMADTDSMSRSIKSTKLKVTKGGTSFAFICYICGVCAVC